MTLHSLADRRAAAVPAARLDHDDPETAPDPEESRDWELLAERAGQVLAGLEANANHGADLSALLAETAGLRAALIAANERRLSIRAIIMATRKRVEQESGA